MAHQRDKIYKDESGKKSDLYTYKPVLQ